ncbi:MAG: MATE family efflux transporter [Desulfovibrionaceae bacterium]|nr:MATE family efflux transporter [Desulfovibrionaceae bacterium]
MAKSLTSGHPSRLLITFALPMMLGNLFQLFYSMADIIIVGRTLGVDALAGVGLTGPLGFMFISLVIGMSHGFSILCAQNFGAENKAQVRRTFCASLVLGLIISLILALASFLVEPALHLTNAPENAFKHALIYLRTTLLGGAGLVFYNILSSSITAIGDSRTPLVFLILTCIFNIILDLVLILGFHMQTDGAALATVLALSTSALLCLRHIWRKIPELRPHKNDWRHLSWPLFRRLITLGLPMGLQGAVINIGFIIVQTVLNGLGAEAVAACSSAACIDSIAIMPLISMSRAMSTYVGQNIGAGRPDRVRQGVRNASCMAFIYAWFAALLCFSLARPMIGIFVGTEQDTVITLGKRLLTIQCGLYWLLALLFIIRSTLQGLGKSFITTLSSLGELVMRCLAAILLVGPLGFDGICVASPLAWVAGVAILIPAYYAWKKENATPTPSNLKPE